jgi:hypothetical protein
MIGVSLAFLVVEESSLAMPLLLTIQKLPVILLHMMTFLVKETRERLGWR